MVRTSTMWNVTTCISVEVQVVYVDRQTLIRVKISQCIKSTISPPSDGVKGGYHFALRLFVTTFFFLPYYDLGSWYVVYYGMFTD